MGAARPAPGAGRPAAQAAQHLRPPAVRVGPGGCRLETLGQVRADRGVVRGFKVALDGENVRHDFTAAAIAEAMAAMVRPRLAEILRQASQPAAPPAG